MIVNVVRQPVRAEYADEWPSLVREITEASQAEPGCITYEWCRSADDPATWVLIEVFCDAEAGQAHVESEHFKAAMAKMTRWLAAAPEIIHVETEGDGWSSVSEGS